MSVRAENITYVVRGRDKRPLTILDIPHFELADAARLCLVGGSGSGKTTFLNILVGITLPTTGAVRHDDVDIVKLSESARDRLRAERIGYVFQTFNLLQPLSALENVRIAQTFAGQSGAAARERAGTLLRRMGLGDRLHERPGTLSVGEQQRVAIARAVVNRPRLLIADEPTASLDEKNGDEVLAILSEVAAEEKSTLLLVTHEERVMRRFGGEIRNLSEIRR